MWCMYKTSLTTVTLDGAYGHLVSYQSVSKLKCKVTVYFYYVVCAQLGFDFLVQVYRLSQKVWKTWKFAKFVQKLRLRPKIPWAFDLQQYGLAFKRLTVFASTTKKLDHTLSTRKPLIFFQRPFFEPFSFEMESRARKRLYSKVVKTRAKDETILKRTAFKKLAIEAEVWDSIIDRKLLLPCSRSWLMEPLC